MKFSEEITSESMLPALAHRLLNFAGQRRIFLFSGEMGSGKTTLIKELCKHLGAEEGLSSPTFSIVNEYLTATGKKVYHFDLYRLKNTQEAADIGMEDYLDSGNYCFIEWPEIAEQLYPAETLKIRIETSGEKRIISAE